MSTISAFTSSLVFNVAITLLLLLLFCIIRPRFDFVYQPNFKLLTEFMSSKVSTKKTALLNKLKLPSSLFCWLTISFKVDVDELYDLVGFDAFIYLRFLRLCLRIAVFSLPYTAAVIIPVNVSGESELSGMDALTLGNISEQSSKLWTHLVGLWLFSFLVYYMLYTEWKMYVHYRQKFLKENRENNFTLLVTQLSPKIFSIHHVPHNEELKKLVNKIFPDQIAFCDVIENTEDWQKLLTKHDELVLKYEHAQAVLKETDERPEHRLKPFIGSKVDSIDYYEEELKNLQDDLISHEIDEKRPSLRAAIVTFKTLRDACIASQVLWQAKPYHTMIQPAPEYRNIIWENLGLSLFFGWLRWVIITVLLFFLVVFWMIPVSFVQSLVTLESLQKKISFLNFVNDLNPAALGLIEGVLSTLAFVVFFAILPKIMRFLSKQQGLLSFSEVESSMIEKLYVFTIVNKFLGSVLAGAFFDRVQGILDHPTTIPRLLAMSLPSVASFFINFVILQSLTGHATSLLRILPFVIGNVKKIWFAKTERDKKMLWNPPPPPYGEMYSGDLFVFIIGVSYCIQAPIVVPFVAFYFGFGYITRFYSLVYVMKPQFNAGGKMWIPVFNRRLTRNTFAIKIFHLCML
ncbi:CSC1-like protein At1g62320 isoform X2 [Xenia sp. Carnegie-2017]|uniref:CSC1-like protein At1g62320 isoform X2 n=1 Tax=Xenia sp. Carnegie-2017 TaxID=2897299 RepID=UPI001F044917|nr:CSC1-like protein At1g62320 isoform X2 [Xenia sp. Carnegie-2017]